MQQFSFFSTFLALSPVLIYTRFVTADLHHHDKDSGLFSFVTHPEFKAPRWNVNITEPNLVSPGYWFVAPFEFIDQKEPGNGYIGPHIYDGSGELVWSGASLNGGWDAIDFKMSKVRGEDRMTFLNQHTGNGLIVDDTFQTREIVDVGTLGEDFNSHEFYFIEDGKKAIVMTEGRRNATKEQTLAVEWEKECIGLFNGFKVLDTATWESVFEWSTFGNIGLSDSSYLDGGVEARCGGWGWDFVHLNSVDVDHNGDFYVSARYADSIYKVSKDDGHVIWRLHGRQADGGEWDMNGTSFSRQHNVRFRAFNGTHEIITILDNANAQDEQHASHDSSRGLTIALQTDVEPKVARIIKSIEHPDGPGNYAPRRGNQQLLPNGHIFMGWSEQATQSEHTEDGQLVMKASLVTEWLGTYRSYKFPFVGRPSHPPKAYSAAYASQSRNTTATMVHASWNGATEIASWNLYKTTEAGTPMIKIFEKQRTGFETAIVWDGFAGYVVVEAVDKSGNVVGRSNIVKTIEPPADAMSSAVVDEFFWLQDMRGENDAWRADVYASSRRVYTAGSSVLIFVFGVLCTMAVLSGFVALWCLRANGCLRMSRARRYKALSAEEQGEMEVEYHYSKEGVRGFRDSDSSE